MAALFAMSAVSLRRRHGSSSSLTQAPSTLLLMRDAVLTGEAASGAAAVAVGEVGGVCGGKLLLQPSPVQEVRGQSVHTR